MVEETTGRKTKLRREGEENPSDASAITVAPTPPTTIPPEVRDELTFIMQNVLLKTHELSFEYSTMECEELANCPLGRKCKELFREVKKLNEIIRKMTQAPQPTYVK
jgi:hypothetical protein